jgi:hypothetical protein
VLREMKVANAARNAAMFERLVARGVPDRGKWAERLLDVGVLFAADSANIEWTSEMLVRRILFCEFRSLFDGGYRFDIV